MTELKGSHRRDDILRNALVESAVLHTRILVDILIDNFKYDDVTISKLLPNWREIDKLRTAIEQLKSVYGSSVNEKSPCGTINKMLAHPSKLRGSSFDYSSTLSKLDPAVVKVIKLLGRGSEKIPSEGSADEYEMYTTYPTTTIIIRNLNENDTHGTSTH